MSHYSWYVAAGFAKDAEDLLDEFSRLRTTTFSAFADLWRRRRFSLVFMGRQSESELHEFTQEAFTLTLSFIPSVTSFLHEIGAIYLLYALFRNQPSDPPARVRCPCLQAQRIVAIQQVVGQQCPSLHYVVGYLLRNALDFVAAPRLFGPTVPVAADEWRVTNHVVGQRVITDARKSMEGFVRGADLGDVAGMLDRYARLTLRVGMARSAGDGSPAALRELESQLEGLLGSGKGSTASGRVVQDQGGRSSPSIGSRRAVLKAKAFCGSGDDHRAPTSEGGGPVRPSLPRVRPRKKRVPKSEKRVGRKKKVVHQQQEEEEELEASGVQLEQLLSGPGVGPGRRRRTGTRDYSRPDRLEDQELDLWRDLPDMTGEMFACPDEFVPDSDCSSSSSECVEEEGAPLEEGIAGNVD